MDNKIDRRKIPKGKHCFRIMGSLRQRNDGKTGINIKYCPYFVKKEKKGHMITFCKLLHIAVVDNGSLECLLWDRRKSCGIKEDEFEDEKNEATI
jgi:hypothetical protein